MFFLILFSWLFASETIHVRLFSDLNEAKIEADTFQIGSHKVSNSKISIRFDGKWMIYADDKVILKSKDAKPLKVQAQSMRVFHRQLDKEVHLIWNKRRAGIDIIAPIDISDYLKGVIPAEMPASWPEEAIKAQVVASKSYVLSQIKEKADLHYDVDASVMDQVYNLDRFERLSPSLQKKVVRAINNTEDLFLFFNKDVLKAYFHSHCGGHTENPKQVWQSASDWLGVEDPYCNGLKPFQWKHQISKKELAAKASQFFKEKPASLNKIVEGERNRSGRLEEIFLFFDDGRIRGWKTQDLRESLGFSNVKSTQMKVQFEGDQVHFQGEGYGHGVGMCQHGAKKMARIGKSYEEILKFYYPSAKLAKRSLETNLVAHKEK